jgi:hypothetical protein
MGYFSTPIAVKPVPAAGAVRISVRASESRVDEWTVLHRDVESVLSGYEEDFFGWRGVGELRVRLGRSGADVAFYSGDDRALLRLSTSEAASFMAHLHAAFYELGGELPFSRHSVKPTETPSQSLAVPSSTAHVAELESLRGTMQQIMMAVITLTSDVNRMMRQLTERDAERAAAPPQIVVVAAPTAAAPTEIKAVVAPAPEAPRAPEESEMFIPAMRASEITGTGLEAKEKSGAGDDLAAAAAALKAAKKRRVKKKEEG